MECGTVNIIWKVLQRMWSLLLQVECCVFQWTLFGKYCTPGDSGIKCRLECVTVNIMWKVLHSSLAVLLQVGWSVLQLTLYGSYCTTSGQYYCRLNGLCYSEQYMEVNAHAVDSKIADWMECVTVNIMWMLLHSSWTVLLQLDWSVLQWTLFGSYCTAGGQFYYRLNGVCYSELYVEVTS